MEQDNNANNTRRSSSSFQDAQGCWYSHLSSPDYFLPTTTTTTSISTSTITSDQQQTEGEDITSTETIIISTDDDDNNKDNHSQQSTATIRSARLSEEWLPPATSTPLFVAPNMPRSQQDEENQLFNNIEQLIRDFAQQPSRRYPMNKFKNISFMFFLIC